MNCGIRILSVAAALSSAAVVQAQGSAWELLTRMNETVRMRNYTGTIVLSSGAQIDTLKIYHAYSGQDEIERVVSLSGEEREVIRQDGELRVILPQQGVVIVELDDGRGLLPQLGESAIQRLSDHYRLTVVKAIGRVAGRSTRELRIRPRDDWRWGYRIWLDEESAMPLELQMVSPQMEILEQVHFTEIQFHDMLSPAAMRSSIDVSELQVIRAKADTQNAERLRILDGWEVDAPPPGFRLSTRSLRRLPGINSPVAHWVYSDGLASVSLYATESASGPVTSTEDLESGSVSTVRRLIGRMQITAMGEVPLKTSRHFSQALKPVVQQ